MDRKKACVVCRRQIILQLAIRSALPALQGACKYKCSSHGTGCKKRSGYGRALLGRLVGGWKTRGYRGWRKIPVQLNIWPYPAASGATN